MAHLFSPLTIGRAELPNRVVMAPLLSGCATADGFINEALVDYYAQLAWGGVGAIMTEPLIVAPPGSGSLRNHVGIYDDAFVPQLRLAVAAATSFGTRVIALLDAPAEEVAGVGAPLLAERFLLAAWRARAAGCDGVMLSAADGGALHTLLSPRQNPRFDSYSGSPAARLRLPLEIIEGICSWLGRHSILGFRIVAEEFTPGGLKLQDARVIARRLVAAGVNLLDVTVDAGVDTPVARFPGWCIPLASGIKRVVNDVPVIGSGLLGEPQLANSLICDGSVDLVMLGHTLRANPGWPRQAHALLCGESYRKIQSGPLDRYDI